MKNLIKDFKRWHWLCKRKDLYDIIVGYQTIIYPQSIFGRELLILPYFSEAFIQKTIKDVMGYRVVSCKKCYSNWITSLLDCPAHIIVLAEK